MHGYFDGKPSGGISFVAAVCLAVRGKESGTLTHTHCSLYVVVKSLHSLTLGHPDIMYWFSPTTLLCTFPSQSAHPVREESVCLNLLFVIQVISEEGVSFKVSLFSHYLSFPPLLSVSLSCSYLSVFLSFCDVIPW